MDHASVIAAQRREIRRLLERCQELQRQIVAADQRAADAESLMAEMVRGRAA